MLKARINALKWEKNKHDKKQKKHSSEIDFIHTVRDRLYEDRKYKLDVHFAIHTGSIEKIARTIILETAGDIDEREDAKG